jgi:hypothetical protein
MSQKTYSRLRRLYAASQAVLMLLASSLLAAAFLSGLDGAVAGSV